LPLPFADSSLCRAFLKLWVSFPVVVNINVDVLFFSGPDNLVNLKKIAQQYQRQEAAGPIEEEEDVPELVEGENFEDASKEEAKTA